MSRRPGRKKRLIRLIILLCAVSIVIFVLSRIFSKKQKDVLSTVRSVTPIVTEIPKTPTPTFTNSKNLEETVKNQLVGTKGKYGVFIKNLKTGESYANLGDKIYQSASLYKLWVMATVYEQVKAGKIKESDILTEDVKTLNEKFRIDEEAAERKDGEVSSSVEDALTQMITVSDNYAALLLAAKVRLSNVATFLTSHGLTHSHVGTNGKAPETTPADIALFFEKLSLGELADPLYTEKMLTLLKRQALNEKIPKYLPEDIIIAHKTGELEGYTHDGGIVYTLKGDYIIVVLSESTSRVQANERIATVSKAVYDYFIKQ